MTKILTIPNLLSVMRIIIALIMWHISATYGLDESRGMLIWLLVLSGITDILDGRIARRFNQISELGKVLDPIADKLTQIVLLICFIHKYETAKYVLLILVIKEIILVILGMKNMIATKKNDGAQWYGKACTVFFYGVVFFLLFIPQIPAYVAELLITVSGILMVISLILYGKYYKELKTH